MFDVRPLWTIIFSFVAAIASILYHSRGSLLICPRNALFISQSPYYPSWNTWTHPSTSGGSKDSHRDWNLFYYLGGYGPWVEKLDGHAESQSIYPPEGCAINQVHMMSRHAERYPTKNAGARHLSLLNRIRDANVVLNGSLSFLNNWTYFTDEPWKDFDQLTRTGPYAGTLQAFMTGVRFLTRYEHLLQPGRRTRIWASDSQRVIDTAAYFASGFFGLDWEKTDTAVLEVIPETFDRHADTLTPGDTCLRYIEDADNGHDNGYTMLARFQNTYIPDIAARLTLKEQNEEIGPLTNLEVWSMQEMCGFETLVRGSSPWCSVFTQKEWESFAYARDVVHYYRAGPGNPYAGAMGWLWLNATTALLHAGPEAGTTFFSFVHDGDIAPFLTALEILQDSRYDPYLPVTHVAEDRTWRTSSVMPMGGRIVIERMACPSSITNNQDSPDEIFLRVIVNDRPMSLRYCKSGPEFSCPLEELVDYVQRRRREVGEFGDVCGLEGDVGHITFLRQD